MNWISSENQTADFLTEPLSKKAFVKYREKCIQSQRTIESKIERRKTERKKKK